MSHVAAVVVDPRDCRLDGRLLRRIWRLTAPYWINRAHWKSWVLVAFGILIGPAWAYYNVRVAELTAQQANLLVVKNQAQWEPLFWLLFFLALGQWVYNQTIGTLNFFMQMQWYRWMTEWAVSRYLRQMTYYDIALKDDIDNPDERIQSSVEPFVSTMTQIPGRLVGTIAGLSTSGFLLARVSTSMTVFVVIYSLLTMVIQVLLYWPLIRKNFAMVAAHADLRFGLLRIRENAETIAFFRGETMEERQVQGRVKYYVKQRVALWFYNVLLVQTTTRALSDIWSISPLFFLYPMFFSGQIEFGTIALATVAATALRATLTGIDDYMELFGIAAPQIVRLSQIVERYETLEANAARTDLQIEIERDDRIELRDVCFQTPGGEQQLAQHVRLAVESGESLVIIGQTGVGKSSILRTMAGLWTRGTGVMVMPERENMMFVPQKPYMMLGSLREQLLYPYGNADMSDGELQAVLERVCLPDLVEKAGGLDANREWSKVFSLGEQQRIAFARILISRPRFVFLDESTSAIDIPTEAKLYQTLVEEGTTYVSVGHRETILRFHDRALRLLVGGGWEIIDASTIEATPIRPLGSYRSASAPLEETSV